MGENKTKMCTDIYVTTLQIKFLQWPGKTVTTYIQEQQIVDGI